MQRVKTFFTQNYGLIFGFLLWGFLFIKYLWPVLIDRTQVIHGDTVWCYGIFHYFWESVLQGQIPYWNPYHHGGEPFHFLISHFRLLDPTMVLPLIIAKLFNPNLFDLYYWSEMGREFLYIIGVFCLMKYIFKKPYIVLLLTIAFLTLFQWIPQSQLKRYSSEWTPWLFLAAIYAYQTGSKRAIWITFYVAGMIVGASSYHFIYSFVYSGVFIFLMALFNRKEFFGFCRRHFATLAMGATLFTVMCGPLISNYLNRGSIFPVTRVYGARDHFIDHYKKEGTTSINAPYEAVFLTPSSYTGDTLTLLRLKNYFVRHGDPLYVLVLFFMLLGLIRVRSRYKWILFITSLTCIAFAFGNLPGYRFLYEHIPIFGAIRHTSAFFYPTEIAVLIFVGWGIRDALETKDPSFKYKIQTVLSILFIAVIYKFSWVWCVVLYFCLMVGPSKKRIWPVFLLVLMILGVCIRNTPNPLSPMLIGRNAAIRQPPYIYKEIADHGFKPKAIRFDPTRIYALPRPNFIHYEGLLLKKNLALSTILEPPSGETEVPYTKYWEDFVIGNMVLYWPSAYVDIYLMGEQQIHAFFDVMGVDQPILRFYPMERVFSLSGKDQQKEFSKRSSPRFRLTEKLLFLDGDSDSDRLDSNQTFHSSLKRPFRAHIPYELLSFNANFLSVRVNPASEGYLLFNDTFDPNWKVRINGKPGHIERANLGFKAVKLAPGPSLVEFLYFPASFVYATWVYILINLIAVGYLSVLGVKKCLKGLKSQV